MFANANFREKYQDGTYAPAYEADDFLGVTNYEERKQALQIQRVKDIRALQEAQRKMSLPIDKSKLPKWAM